jgi:hypothetical protein
VLKGLGADGDPSIGLGADGETVAADAQADRPMAAIARRARASSWNWQPTVDDSFKVDCSQMTPASTCLLPVGSDA